MPHGANQVLAWVFFVKKRGFCGCHHAAPDRGVIQITAEGVEWLFFVLRHGFGPQFVSVRLCPDYTSPAPAAVAR